MRSGQMDRRITIERPPVYVDPVYGPQPAPPGTPWDVFGVARMPAQLMDDLPSKNERTEGALKIADRPARVRIRYLRGITSDMRVILHDGPDESGDQVFQIAGGPAEIGRREWTEITVEAYSV